MGLADVVGTIKKDRNRKASHRLFEFSRERAKREKLPMQPGDCFRASSLPYLCPREEVLAHRYDIIRVEFHNPSLEITWTIGDYFHEMYRNEYFGPMGEWAGAWECLRCGWDTDYAGLSAPPVPGESRGRVTPMPQLCDKCNAPFIAPDGVQCYGKFKEWLIQDFRIHLQGHPDGWSIRSGSDRVLSDLKSHGLNGFASRKKIRDGHDLQVWGYQYMCGDTETNGEVWYLNKSPWGDPGAFLREIVVPFDRKKFETSVVRPLGQIQDGLSGGPLADRVCINDQCPRARECQLSDVCFDSY